MRTLLAQLPCSTPLRVPPFPHFQQYLLATSYITVISVVIGRDLSEYVQLFEDFYHFLSKLAVSPTKFHFPLL